MTCDECGAEIEYDCTLCDDCFFSEGEPMSLEQYAALTLADMAVLP